MDIRITHFGDPWQLDDGTLNTHDGSVTDCVACGCPDDEERP